MPAEHLEKDARKTDGVSGRLFVQAIRRHPLLMTMVVLLTVGATAVVWYALPLPRHTGAVVFHVASQPPTVLAPTTEGRVDFTIYRQTQAALVKKRVVLADALRQPNVANLPMVREQTDPVGWLEQALVVDFKSGTEVMRLSLEGDDPEQLQAILGAVAKSYLAAVDDRENGQRRQRLGKLDEARKEHQARLDSFQKGIDAIAIRLGSKDGATLAVVDQLTREELGHATRELNEIEAELQAVAPPRRVEGSPPPPIPAALIDEQLRKDPGIVQLEADAVRARNNAAEVESLLKPGIVTPVLTRARDDAKAAEDRLARAKAELRPKLESLLREQRSAEIEHKDAQAGESVERLKRRQRSIGNRIEEVKEKIGANNRFRIDLENLKLQIGNLDKLSGSITDEMDRLRMELGASPRITLAEEPYTLPGLQGNRRLKMTLLAMVGVFLAGYGGLVVWEYRTCRVTHPQDASFGLGLKLLGTVPPISSREARGRDAYHELSEAIDTTRTLLLHGGPADRPIRTVLVTSAIDGEGKTSLAGHLAISLTRAGYRTLLVDGDVRAPSAHELFDVPAAPGLCEALRGESDVSSVIHLTHFPGLSILPSGAWDLGARQALSGTKWAAIRRELEREYDFIVVDSGPVLLVSDSLLMARDTDGVLLSVLIDVSRVASVEETRDRLSAIGANVLGVVVNGVVTPSYRSVQTRGPAAPVRIGTEAGLPA